ncbi:MAG TPA: OsmC family protein [Solirubrobacterales bacterium]|jgi:putative redox protein|nr:OsmC family protein [Solirubrobacterales bacterium]
MRVVARRRSGFAHDIDIEDGEHRLLTDEPVEAGGEGAGPAPTRLVAAGLAGCVAITMEMYAERKGWELGEVEVTVDVEYERHTPRSFSTSIHLPAELSEEQCEALLKIAGRCPVHRVLAHETDVDISYRVKEG